MAAPWVEAANLCVGVGVSIAFVITFGVAAANGGFVDVDATNADNATLTTVHRMADAVTESLADLDIDIDSYGRAVQIGCRIAEFKCPHKISGVAVASISTGALAVCLLVVGLWLRTQRPERRYRGGRAQRLYPEL